MMMVRHIEDGTVLDHIDSGKGLDVYRILDDDTSGVSVLALNVSSKKHGKKDVLKLENTYVDDNRLNIISLIAPSTTVSIIKNGKVSKKKKLSLPKEIKGLLKCLNPECITNAEREPILTRFSVNDKPIRLTCEYCGKEFDERLASTM